MFCETDIYHPNIDTTEIEYDSSSSNVCLNILDSGTWSRKFGLEGAVLGLVFLLHNPNLADPLAPDIDRDEETFEENVKKYMMGEEVEGRTFTADFLKDLQAQNITDESADNTTEKSDKVDVDNTNGDNAANVPSDIKDKDALLSELEQLGIADEKTQDNENDECACTLVSLAGDTVLVPYGSAEILQGLESASEMDQTDNEAVPTTTEISHSSDQNSDDMCDTYSAVNSIVSELVENAMNTCTNDEDSNVVCVATVSFEDNASKETDTLNVCIETDKLTTDSANAATTSGTQDNQPLVRTDTQNVVSEEVTLRKPGFSRQKSKEYADNGGHLFHTCAPYIKCIVLHTFRCLTRL